MPPKTETAPIKGYYGNEIFGGWEEEKQFFLFLLLLPLVSRSLSRLLLRGSLQLGMKIPAAIRHMAMCDAPIFTVFPVKNINF